jgi:hypothetical protein
MTSMTAHDTTRDTEFSPGSRAGVLTVFVGCEGRNLFEEIHDDRIRVVSCGSEAPHETDLVVLPCGRDRRFENVLAKPLPEHLRMRLPDGSVGVVFDASLEAVPHKPDITASLHEVVRRLEVSPLNCVYVTQDRNYEADYRSHCADIGLEPRVAVLNHDYWIWQSLAAFEADGEQVYRHRLHSFRSRPACRARRFISLNRTPRPIKILFLLSLLRDDLWNAGFISFGGFGEPGGTGKPKPTAEQLAQALPGFQDKVGQLTPMLDVLDGYGRVLLGMERHGWKRLDLSHAGLAADLAEYDESWFTVVTETEMRARPSRITEKVIKPLVNFHPVIVLGNPGALKMIHSFGFATFDEIVDESYDDEWDPRRRFDLAYGEFVRMCRLGDDQLRKIEAAIADKLIFNARWGLTRFPNIYRRQRDVALVNDILSAVARRPPG